MLVAEWLGSGLQIRVIRSLREFESHPALQMTEIWKRDEIESPCIKMCSIHTRVKICVGCFRTIEEIGTWSNMHPIERKKIIAELPVREQLLRVRRKK